MPKPVNKLSARTKDWAAWFKETSEHQVSWHGDPPRELRWKFVVGAAGATFAIGWLGYQLLTSNFNTSDLPSALVPNNGLAVATESASPSSTAKIAATIVAVAAYDPLGDQQENDKSIGAIVDSDPASTWTTATYKSADLGKEGVGVVLDLGESQTVSQVLITFEASGQDVEVYVSDDPEPDLKASTKLGALSQTESTATIDPSASASGRYVVIWLTKLPEVNNGFATGIANVQVLL